MTGKVTLLGSGTSNGVPIIGHAYPESFLANPKNHRLRPSILISSQGENLLVDATPDMRTQLLRAGVMDLKAALITHTHADHVMGLDDLRAFSLKYKKPFALYAWEQYQDDIRRIFPYAFADFPPNVEVPRFELIDVPPLIQLGSIAIETFRVWHGKLPVVALKAGSFAYITDVSEIPEDVWPHMEGLETLVLDAVRYRPHPNHFHFEKAIEIAQQLNAKRTFFTHLSHDYDHDVVNAELPVGIELAFDGLEILL